MQFVILGESQATDKVGAVLERQLREFREASPDEVLFYDGFDVALSHLVYGVSELFAQPSSFEPCGLTQQISMAYGSVPVVRPVGGFRNTVIDEADSLRRDHSTGFVTREVVTSASEDSLDAAATLFTETLLRAFLVRRDSGRWNELVTNGMKRDASWEVPSRQYVQLYEEAIRCCVRDSYFTSSRKTDRSLADAALL